MIWLTWRQFRAQALVTGGLLAAIAAYLVYLGVASRDDYDTDIVGCAADACPIAIRLFRGDYGDQLGIIGMLLIALPGVIGVFWGAPLVTRELEERTDRLVWNQSVTRTRWLAAKLGVVGLAAVVITGLFSLLLTWSASRYDLVAGERFAALNFDARNVVPVGYGLFAFALGTVVGMLVRRTLPAMAITLAVFAVVQIVVPLGVRQHLMPPVTSTVAVTEDTLSRIDGLAIQEKGFFIIGYLPAGGWGLNDESKVYKADGSEFSAEDVKPCAALMDREEHEKCLAGLNLHFEFSYHPGSRYWPFQWIELSLFVFLAALLAGFGFWWLRRRV